MRNANVNGNTTNVNNQHRVKTKAPDCPAINTNTDEHEWDLFKDSWNRDKTMTAITNENVIRMELRAACSQDVNRLLFQYVGATSLNATTKNDLLQHIKSVAVKGTHKKVHRIKFFRLSQMDGETITQYVTRLSSQAVLCQFKVACTNHDQQRMLINKSFPNSQTAAAESEGNCNCSKRTGTPQRPTQILFKPTPKNVPKLKQWLLDSFPSSTFNNVRTSRYQQ